VKLEDPEMEELVQLSIAIIKETRRASTASLQRRLRLGYTRANMIMEELEFRGLVGPFMGDAPREVLIPEDAK
jgi:S-DNA-T family DNA segregation ATPase FtsK/SpoIIIE